MLLLLFPLFLFFSLIFSASPFSGNTHFESLAEHHRYVIEEAGKKIAFDLVDPGEAPAEVRESVMKGYRLFMDTPHYASEYVGDLISCNSCHFNGGDTLGGRNNGISLVGVAAVYPQYSSRIKKVIDLPQRINNCFERSMNGLPLPKDSDEMKALVAYLNWISFEVIAVKNPPWLGLPALASKHVSDPKKGEDLYMTNCALCHGKGGEGGAILPEPVGKTIPPLWGDQSFNDGAGMYEEQTLAAFIFYNMPFENSVLSQEESLDVAAFIREQPRPHYQK